MRVDAEGASMQSAVSRSPRKQRKRRHAASLIANSSRPGVADTAVVGKKPRIGVYNAGTQVLEAGDRASILSDHQSAIEPLQSKSIKGLAATSQSAPIAIDDSEGEDKPEHSMKSANGPDAQSGPRPFPADISSQQGSNVITLAQIPRPQRSHPRTNFQ